MSFLLAKYNTQTDFYFPMVKRGVVDLAVTADWTPATGDTKVSKDGGATANTTNNPAIASGTSWKLTLTATELSAKWITVQIVDSATKAIEDQFLTILTYGNASAFFIAPDFQDAVRFGLTALPNANAEAAGGLYTRGSGAGQINQPVNGLVDVNTLRWSGTAVATPNTAGVPLVDLRSWARVNTAQAGGATSITLDASASATNDLYKGLAVDILSGTGAGQERYITAYNGATKVATVHRAWATNPDNTSVFAVRDTVESDLETWGFSAPNALNSGTVQADVERWVNAVPNALVSSRVDASVGAMANNVLTAAAINADAITAAKVADGTIDAATFAAGAINAAAIAADAITAAKIQDGAIDRATFAADTGLQAIRSNTAQAGAAGTITLDASASATDDFYNNTLVYLTGGPGAGQVRRITDYVGSTKVATTKPNWTTNPDNTSTFAIRPMTSSWDEVTADHLTSGSTGASLNAAGSAGDPWGTALPGAYGSGSAGNIVGNNLNATVSSRSSHTAADVWAVGTRALTDKAGFSLSSAGIQAIWDALTSALTTVGSIGKLLVDNINATISSRLATSGYTTPPTAAQVSTQVWTEPIPGAFAAGSAGVKLNTAASAGAGADPATIADAVWDEAISGHLTAGTTGRKLNDLSGAAGSGSIGYTQTFTRVDTAAPIDDVQVGCYTDGAGTNLVASGRTNAAGQVSFQLDAGTYYLRASKSGFNFPNPITIVVS